MNKPITEEQKDFLKTAGFDDEKIAAIGEMQSKEVSPELALKEEVKEVEETQTIEVEEEKAKKAVEPALMGEASQAEMDATPTPPDAPASGDPAADPEDDPEDV